MDTRYKKMIRRHAWALVQNYVVGLLALIFIAKLGFVVADTVLDQVDARVCLTASPEAYIELHCAEVK